MARPRKPSNILELSGAFKKNPKRGKARKNEPVVTAEIGEPPTWFDENLKNAWSFVVRVAPEGVLKISDKPFVSNICYLQVKVWDGSATSGDIQLLQSCYGKLGMNPSDRSKVSVPIKPKINQWTTLAR